MATPDVRVRLSAEGVAEVVAALRKVQAEAQAAGKKGASGFSSLNQGLSATRRLLAQLGVALSVGAFVAFVKRTADAAEGVDKLGQRLGKTSEEMLALSLVAQRTKTDVELVAKSVVFLGGRVEDLRAGTGDAAAQFRQLGLTAKSFEGKNVTQQYELVTKRLGEMSNSGEKAILTNKLLGKSAQQLIPFLNDLASGALSQSIERLRAFRISPKLISDVEALDGALDTLSEDARLVGLAFVGGMAGPVTDAIQAMTHEVESSADAWRDLGAVVGNILKGIVLATWLTVDTVGTAFVGVAASIAEAFFRMANFVTLGVFPRLEKTAELLAKGQRETFENLTRDWQRAFELISGGTKGDRKPRARVTLPTPDPTDLFRQREQAQKALTDNELKLIEARLSNETEAQRRAFDQGLTDVRAYYRQRRVLIERGIAAEMDALNDQIAFQKSENVDSIDRAKKLGDLEARMAVLRTREAGLLSENAAAERKSIRDLADDRLGFIQKQLELEGERHRAAILDLRAESEALDLILRRQGVPDQEREREVTQFLESSLARLKAEERDREIQQALNELALERRSIEADILAGRISELAGEEKILALERERLPQLRAIAEAQLQAALATKDEVAIFEARERIVALDELEASILRAADATRELKDGFQSVIESTARSFLLLEDDVLRAEGTVKHFFFTVIDGLRRILVQILAMQFARRIGGLFAGGGGGGSLGLKRGGLVRRAAGGIVSGPGTGTSDSIPARLSAGEYVVRAAAVRQPGILPHLEAINRGPAFTREDILQAQLGMRNVRLRSLADFSRPPRFAEGGLVGAAAGGGQGVQALEGILTFVLPEGVQMNIEAPEHVRKLLHVVSKNPRAFRRALGS